MQGLDIFLLSLGCILSLGLITSSIGERTALPRVTLLLLLGMAMGADGFVLLPDVFTNYFDTIAQITLMIVGFLIGGKLRFNELRKSAKMVIAISISTALITALLVCLGLAWAGTDIKLAILLGAIASATAPAAIIDVVQESGIDSEFTRTLVSIVALDDVWALLLFALSMAFVADLNGVSDLDFIALALFEVFGALALGALIGIPSAYVTGRIRSGQPMMLEAVSLVCLCGGLALYFEVSYLLATMTMGATVVNLAKHHAQPFHEIENIENLFLIVFFVVAGASLELTMLSSLGTLGAIFVIFRIMGKYVGAWSGARLVNAGKPISVCMPLALLPQAGVSIGMALVAAYQFPEYEKTILTLIIGSTVLFELVGPMFTKIAIGHAHNLESN